MRSPPRPLRLLPGRSLNSGLCRKISQRMRGCPGGRSTSRPWPRTKLYATPAREIDYEKECIVLECEMKAAVSALIDAERLAGVS